MTASSFPVWWDFCQLPGNDGQANDGANTRWGWTFTTWATARRWQGMRDISRATFNLFTQVQFGTLAYSFFWNRQGGALLPVGSDVSVIDWVWTSGGASFDLQRDVGFFGSELDGLIGPKTVATILAHYPDPANYCENVRDMRVQYYEDQGLLVDHHDGTYGGEYPGLGTRADGCLKLSLGLMGNG